MSEKKDRLNFYIEDGIGRKFRLTCVENRKSMSDVMNQLIREYVEREEEKKRAKK